uniref:PAZ domain-containing protein n=1 Tax=Romanomermis culicivorax TaxID=13658 RepID=A0A915KIE6_ROMCU
MMEQFLVENVERTDKESTNNGPADVEYFTKYYYRMQKQSACYPFPLSTTEATVDRLFVLPLLPYPRIAYRNHRPFLG